MAGEEHLRRQPQAPGGVDSAPPAAQAKEARPFPVRAVRFGRFELDLEQEELRRSGRPVKLQDQPLRLLKLLAQRAGRVVRREEIRQALWEQDTWVDFEQGINHCIRQLRAALGDDAEAPRYIETLPRKGYRFIAEVESGASAPGQRPRIAVTSPGSPAKPPRRVAVVAAIAVVALVAASGILAVTLFGTSSEDDARLDGSAPRPVLAVLPFANLTGDPENDYLAEGLTEELITQLGRRYVRRLAVIARTSVLGYAKDPPAADVIGAQLGADYILEGSIRREADRLRVSAQLIGTGDQSHLWATSYDRPLDSFMEVQSEVGRRISEALALQLLDPEDRDDHRATARPEAYEAYLRARHLLNRRGRGDAAAALAELQSAVALDPGFARGWSSLARALRMQGRRRDESASHSREAALRALSLDDSVEEAWLTLAMIRFYDDLDPEGAREAFERAIASHPGYAEAHHNFSAYWSIRGEHDKAIASVRRALALDPLSPAVNSDVGWYYYFARRYDEAIAASRKTLEISPRYLWAHRALILSSLALGDVRAAIQACRAEMQQAGAPGPAIAAVGNAGGEAALRSYWLWDLHRWEEWSRRDKAQPAVVGLIYAKLGYRDAALFTLERAFEARSGWETPFLRVDPLLDPLREDPRFQALLDRIETVARTHASL